MSHYTIAVTEFETFQQAIARAEERLKARELELERDRQLLKRQKEALAVLLPLRNEPLTPSTTFIPIEVNGPESLSGVGIGDAISQVLASFPSGTHFSTNDVYDRLLKIPLSFDLQKSRSNIATYLRKFLDRGLINVANDVLGQRATIYVKP
jgi:hypothetical protein